MGDITIDILDFICGCETITPNEDNLYNFLYNRVNKDVLKSVLEVDLGLSYSKYLSDNIEQYCALHHEDRKEILVNNPTIFNLLVRDILTLGLAETGNEAISFLSHPEFSVISIKSLLKEKNNEL